MITGEKSGNAAVGKGAGGMYSSAFCKVYNEFGWNYFPSAFGEQLLEWIRRNEVPVKTSLDLACGTGVLCELLHDQGIEAAGMDFSEGMIAIARERNPGIAYEVADMILYRPEKKFDLVTCTGDAINHIIDLRDVEKIFQNVHYYLKDGGYFIFDILNENEAVPGEAIDLDFSDTVKAKFTISRTEDGMVNLNTSVYENGAFQFEENIRETIHDPSVICDLLRRSGLRVLKCADRLLEEAENPSATWYVVAQK